MRIHTLPKGVHLAPLTLRIPRIPAPHRSQVVGPYTLLDWNLRMRSLGPVGPWVNAMSGEAAGGRL